MYNLFLKKLVPNLELIKTYITFTKQLNKHTMKNITQSIIDWAVEVFLPLLGLGFLFFTAWHLIKYIIDTKFLF